MGESEWFHCDIVMNYRSRKRPKKIGNFTPAGALLACAISSDMLKDLALGELRKYLIIINPELTNDDFDLEMGCHDHFNTHFPREELIFFITPAGCTLGPPK